MALTCIKRAIASLTAAAACCAFAGDALTDLAAARESAQRGQLRALEEWRARNPGHALEPYASYWILSGSLDRHGPAQVAAFLDRYPDTPLAHSLRREWLRVLGGSGRWEAFRAELPRVLAEDGDITCYAFQDRLARDEPGTVEEARNFFLPPRETPAACDAVFAALARSGAISEADIASRLRRLLAAGALREARRTNALLPARSRINEKLLDRAAADASRYLAKEARTTLATGNERNLAFFAVTRLARAGKVDEAAERLAQLAPALGADLAREAWAHVATQAAMAHHPFALQWYANAGDAVRGDEQLGWMARASMRAGDWKRAREAIDRLSPEEARESGWTYWRARTLRAAGEREAAQAVLRGLSVQRNFYGILAAEELGAVAAPDWNGWRPQAADLERVRALPAVQRALALYRLNYDAEAMREWVWATRAMDDRDLLAAAEIAHQAGELDRAIATANRTAQLHDLGQRFPVHYREAVSAAALQWGLDEATLFALIRQESRFLPEARSRAGAAGLMQLMPATARWVARQIPVQPFKAGMLEEPAVNVQMGTYYYGRVLGDLGHPVLAIAAYNAGPGRARRWRDARALEGALYVETIPFNETRDYVKQVMVNAWFYNHRLTGRLASLRDMVGTIPGRDPAAEAAIAASSP